MNSNEKTYKRLHISGLSNSAKEEDLTKMFKKYGEVIGLELVKVTNTNECRGFAYIDIKTSESMTTYNGSQWKGKRVKIDEANPDYKKARECRHASSSQEYSSSTTRLPNKALKKMKYVKHSKDINDLITDKNAGEKQGWKKGRYGRAIRVMRIKFPNGDIKIVDPTLQKDKFIKLFGTEKPKPHSLLQWRYDSDSEIKQSRKKTDTDDENTYIKNTPKKKAKTNEIDNYRKERVIIIREDEQKINAHHEDSNEENPVALPESKLISSPDTPQKEKDSLDLNEDIHHSQAENHAGPSEQDALPKDIPAKANTASVQSKDKNGNLIVQINKSWSSIFEDEATPNDGVLSFSHLLKSKNEGMSNKPGHQDLIEETSSMPLFPKNKISVVDFIQTFPYENFFIDLSLENIPMRFVACSEDPSDIQKIWEDERKALTADYKSKYKSAIRAKKNLLESKRIEAGDLENQLK